jgi:hypothetical protein
LPKRHCEERSDEAIHRATEEEWIASAFAKASADKSLRSQ